MVFGLFKKKPWEAEAYQIYNALVAQARQPFFYSDLGVADTVDGRFDMVLLHAALVIRRLQQEKGDGPAVAQAVFDLMFADMDRNLREMGVGDMSVGKHIKGMAKAFYGRAESYEAGLKGQPEMLAEALRRNLYRKTDVADAQVMRLVGYVQRQAVMLESRTLAQLKQGQLGFSDPAVSDTQQESNQ